MYFNIIKFVYFRYILKKERIVFIKKKYFNEDRCICEELRKYF